MNAYGRIGVQPLLRIGYRRNSKGGIVSIHHRSVMIGLLSLCLAAPGQLAAQSHQDSGPRMNQADSAVPGLHDFDFLVGQWQAHHRKLKQRLANNHEWTEFEGTLLNQSLMGSYSNVDDTVLSIPGAPYRGVALQSFDPRPAVVNLVARQQDAIRTIGSAHDWRLPAMAWALSMGRIRSRESEFGRASSGPTSLRHRVTGSKRTRRTRARPGRQTGCRTSHEFAD